MKLSELIEKLNLDLKENVRGNINIKISSPGSISNAKKNQLTFYTGKDNNYLKSKKDCVIILSKELLKEKLPSENTYIFVENPRLMFIRAMNLLIKKKAVYKICKTAVIDKKTKISQKVYIGDNVFIGPNCTIEENVIIHPKVTILKNTIISKNTVIFSNTVIGADGFGYERNEKLELEKFIHIGGVFVGESVEIGANTCIDLGTLDNTEIGSGTKIDNLVHIAHNVKIGKNCEIIAHSMIGGGVSIGDFTRIAPGAIIREGIKIGKNVIVGLGAVVTKDIPDKSIFAGNPAREIKELKNYLNFINNFLKNPDKFTKIFNER